jgi:hypothetical protein
MQEVLVFHETSVKKDAAGPTLCFLQSHPGQCKIWQMDALQFFSVTRMPGDFLFSGEI